MEKIYTIIRKVKEGDNDAYETLLHLHQKMIFKIINSMDKTLGDFMIDEKDLYQEACLALFEAARLFEADRDVKFSTFAFVHIKNTLLNFVKTYRRKYRDDIYSFDLQGQNLRFAVYDSTVDAYRETQFKEELNNFLNELNEMDRKILLLKGSNYSYKEIAERLNISTKKIDNKLRMLKKRLKKSVINEYLFR